jgi:hypothetical protein
VFRLLPKYPRWAAAITPMTSQTTTMTEMILVMALPG